MLTTQKIASFKLQLAESKKIVIVTHYNPDGDALGSSLALYSFFRNNGYRVCCIAPNSFPNFLDWMPGTDTILMAHKHLITARKIISEADIIFAVDMNAAHRVGKDLEASILESSAYKIMIDHHPSPNLPCNIVYSSTKSSSTCELVYHFLIECFKDKNIISLEMANCIYTGIITDTGSLSYLCNDPKTYSVLEHLVSIGVDGEAIHRMIYDNYSESRLRLLSISLKNMKIMYEHKTSYIFLSKKELVENNFNDGDAEGFVNYGLSIRGIIFTAFFIERENRIRISFRSKGNFDVNTFASTYFLGGGHKNASATYHYDTLENTISYFEDIVRKHPELKTDTVK